MKNPFQSQFQRKRRIFFLSGVGVLIVKILDTRSLGKDINTNLLSHQGLIWYLRLDSERYCEIACPWSLNKQPELNVS